MKAKIHPSAVVDERAQIHPSCEIGPFCFVGPQVKMGPDNKLLSHVVVENRTTIGKGNTFYPFGVIGAEPADLKYKGEATELIIGDHNKIRESVSLHIGTEGGGGVTKIGNDNLLMAYVHLGHDTVIHDHVIIANGCQLAGHVTVEDWAILGGLTAVSQFCRVGAHAYVGGCSGVSKDVAPYTLGLGPVGSFETKGLNLVGLKRRGFSSETISSLMDVNKLFYKDGLEKATALQRIEEKYAQVPEIQYFVDFVKKSEVGIFR